MKQIEVKIMGTPYLLGCPEGGEQALLDAVARVDREMCTIRDAGKLRARERIAVLAALNLAYVLNQRPAAPKAPRNAEGEADAARETATAETANAALAGEGDEAADALIGRLIERLDAALGQDGHLL